MKAQFPIKLLCEVVACPRSSYYYHSRRQCSADLLEALEQVLMHYPGYGYRRVTAQLQREGWVVGTTRVRRLLKELGVSRTVGRVRVSTTDSHHSSWRYPNLIQGMSITKPDQVWVADITYLRLGRRFIYLAVILDAYSRAVRGWHLSRSLEQELVLTALDKALRKGPPLIHHSDQGSQYAAWLHTEKLLAANIPISLSQTGKPQQKGRVERFFRTLKQELIDFIECRDFDEAWLALEHWLEVEYNTRRIHSALDYATPAEFEAAYFQRRS